MERTGHKQVYDDYSRFELKNLSPQQLHERMLADLQPHTDFESRARISAAFDLAEMMHEHDYRANGKYIQHPLRVTNRLITYMEVRDPDILAAALMHDTVEDHPFEMAEMAGFNISDEGEAREIALWMVGDIWGERVERLVNGVSNPPFEKNLTEAQKHDAYQDHVEEAIEDPEVFIIKVSDFIDNAVGLYHTNNAVLIRKLSRKYAPLYDVFISRLVRDDIPLTDEVKKRLLNQLKKGRERNIELLHASHPGYHVLQ